MKGTELVVLPPILVKRPFKVSLPPEFVLSSLSEVIKDLW